jgi:hypothetical protein
MAQYGFGSGSLFGIPSGSNPTPVQFGGLQDVSVDFNFTAKELRGGFQFPIVVARGAGKIAWKAKSARLNGAALNNLFFGGTNATGLQTGQIAEAGTIPAGTPWQITVANSATWLTDLGVVNGTTGVSLTRVASGPTTGQYSVTAGVYTFASADANTPVLISYVYTTAGTGNKTTITNQLMGAQTTFQMVLTETFQSKQLTLTLNACIANKWTIATKLEDFLIPEWDGAAFADNNNVVGTLALSE